MNYLDLDSNELKEKINNYDTNDLFIKNINLPGEESTSQMSNIEPFVFQDNKTFKVNVDSGKDFKFSNKKQKTGESIQVYDLLLVDKYLFACGGSEAKVYSLDKDFLKENNVVSIEFSEDEYLYRLAYTSIGNNYYLIAGGKKSIIYVFELEKNSQRDSLIGHRDEIWDLKICPANNALLLSASADHSVRLWDITNSTMICIFGGNNCHLAQVLSIGWHHSGNYFVSSGIDMKVLLWQFTKEVKDKITENEKIKESKVNRSDFKTLIINKPLFSNNEVHNRIIDAVAFYGNLILVKSSDGLIKLIAPNYNHKDQHLYMIVSTYVTKVNSLTFYRNMYVDEVRRVMVTGTDTGELYIFNLNEDVGKRETEPDFYYKMQASQVISKLESNCTIRSVTANDNIIACGNMDGVIYLYRLNN
jgi:WD40 repeat protein